MQVYGELKSQNCDSTIDDEMLQQIARDECQNQIFAEQTSQTRQAT